MGFVPLAIGQFSCATGCWPVQIERLPV